MIAESLRVLLVDDERSLRQPLAEYLKTQCGFHVDDAADGQEALAKVEANGGRYDVALIDNLLLPEPDGVEVMRRIKARYPEIECIIFTGWGTAERQRALREGAFRYIEKPFDNEELALLIRVAAQQVRLRSISRSILSTHDPGQVLQHILAATRSLTQADEVFVTLQSEASGDLRTFALDHESGALSPAASNGSLLSENLVREVLAAGKTVNIGELPADAAWAEAAWLAGFRSVVGVPIPGPRGNLGALWALRRRSDHLAPGGSVALLQTLAGQAGLAIVNARTFEQTQAQASYMEALVRASRQLTAAGNEEHQLEIAWRFVHQEMGVSTFLVALYDQSTGVLRFPLAYDEGQRVVIPATKVGEDATAWTITALVVKTGEEFYWPTPEHQAETCRAYNIRPRAIGRPCQSCFYFPLKHGDQIIGAVSIQAYRTHAFTSAQLDACRALGNQLAAALANSRLVSATRKLATDLEKLQRLSTAIASSLDLKEVMTRTCQAAVEFFQADHSGLVLFDEDLCWGTTAAEYPPDLGTVGQRIPLEGIPDEERLVHGGEPLVVEDVANEVDLGPVRNILYDQYGIQSILIVPIISKGKRLGSFSLDAIQQRRRFTDQELELCRMFAAQVAAAIENAQRAEELERMRRAAEALAQTAAPADTLAKITHWAAETLRAASVVIWPYDNVRRKFIPDELTAVGISDEDLQRLRESEPAPGQTTEYVLERGYVAVADASDPQHTFIGQSTRNTLRRLGVRSFQAVALRLGEERLGVLYVNYRFRRVFASDDETTLKTFASHAALALKSARLLTQLERTKRAASVVAGAVVQQDLRLTLAEIANNTREVLNADVVTVYAYDESKGRFTDEGISIVDQRRPNSIRTADELLPASTPYRILEISGPPYYRLADDLAKQDPILGGKFTEVEEVRASVGIQLRANDRRVGVMFVNFRQPHRFTDDMIATVQLFADQAAAAVRNTQLYNQTAHLLERLELVTRISRQAASNLEIDAFLESLFTSLTEVFARRGVLIYPSLATYDKTDQTLVTYHTRFYPTDVRPNRVSIYSRGIMAWVARERKPYQARDVREDQNYNLLLPDTLSEIAVPVFYGDELLAVLDLESPVLDAFGATDIALLEALSNHIAVTLHNVQQYAELKRTKGLAGARTAVAWMGMVSSDWMHRVRGDAVVIRDVVGLLQQELQPVSPQVREWFDRIQRRLASILEAPISPPLQPDQDVFPVDIGVFVQEALQRLQRRDRYSPIAFELDIRLPEGVLVRADPHWLQRVLEILVDNAAKAVAKTPVKRIGVSVYSPSTSVVKGGVVNIAVEDTGPGIPDEISAVLFKEPVRKSPGSGGAGLGLLMAQTIVQTYGGDIYLEHTSAAGTRMVFWLPIENHKEREP
ncbi:MAG: GAF domain-containing protein [Caldilineales bacterium]|nr:GAF domain-containing protein [Caldilineales bacterium]MDW8316855.1 GAF domain-containing protein [Anaerolineae bacterium]